MKLIKPMKLVTGIFLTIILLLISACSNLGYYAQSASGQLDVINRTVPIQSLLDKADTDPVLKTRLQLVLQIRDFASSELGLPDNDSYRSYADLERPYAIWNVFAAPSLSLESTRWCFPFAGCVSYKGYFNEQDAKDFAAELKKQGQDVYVAGISAYSTLGWFDDPMLNTIINRYDPELAGLIFHELAHQQVYVQNDTEFNESFAMTVELAGTKSWLDSVNINKKNSEKIYQDFVTRKKRRLQFVELVMETRGKLALVYQADTNDSEKLIQKATIIKILRKQYATIRKTWRGYPGYDKWFNSEINNAKLGSIGTYHRFVPAFKKLLVKGKTFENFYRAVKKLSRLEKSERHTALDKLVAD